MAIINGTNAPELLIGGSASDFISGFGGDDVLVGLEGNDVLVGDSGIDQIGGGVGNDVLVGGIGFDKLVGGTEADTFRYLSTADSGVGILGSFRRDVIADFVHGQDKIDLTTVYNKAGTADDEAFTFIGSAGFTAEGQVRVVTEGDHMLVQMNTSATTGIGFDSAESEIQLTGNIDVTATDFVL